jgi:hypothetical protein
VSYLARPNFFSSVLSNAHSTLYPLEYAHATAAAASTSAAMHTVHAAREKTDESAYKGEEIDEEDEDIKGTEEKESKRKEGSGREEMSDGEEESTVGEGGTFSDGAESDADTAPQLCLCPCPSVGACDVFAQANVHPARPKLH